MGEFVEMVGIPNLLIKHLKENHEISEELEKEIKKAAFAIYKEGYENCLKDVREGLIK